MMSIDMENKSNTKIWGGIAPAVCSIGVILFFALVLIIPGSREVFKTLSSSHPYLMGFVKFGLLATCGEVFAFSIKRKAWAFPRYTPVRALIWGLIGIAITFMMKVYSNAVISMMDSGLLPAPENTDGFGWNLLRAFFTAAIMNLTFGPTFMAFHKCTDTYLALREQGIKKPGLDGVIAAVNWKTLIRFTFFKTIPLFWIPAHTLTFLLPAEYQVIMAAGLSIALGIMLSLKK